MLPEQSPKPSKVADLDLPIAFQPERQEQSEAHEALIALNKIFPEVNLSNIQAIVFVHSWQGKTYQNIAKSIGYDADYIKDVGHKLWKQLSKSLGENISKKNLCSVVRKHYLRLQEERREGSNLVTLSAYQERGTTETTRYDWGESPLIPIFIERPHLFEKLEAWVLTEQRHLVGLFGFGGLGKTVLAIKFAERMQGQFEHVIWRSLRNPKPFAAFVTDILQSLTGAPITNLSTEPATQINLLLKALQERRCLLILDDWFSLLRPQQLVGSYAQEHHAYGFFLRRISESRTNSCVMVTSREKPGGLAFKEHQNSCVRSLFVPGFALEPGQTLLQEYGLNKSDPYLENLVKIYGGNPYFLRVVTHTILNLFGGSIENFMRRDNIIYGDIRHLIKRQFNRLTKLEKLIIYCMVDLHEWVSVIELEEQLALPGQLDPILEAVESLFCRAFIVQKQGLLNMPPLLRRYVCAIKGCAPTKKVSTSSDWSSPLLGG